MHIDSLVETAEERGYLTVEDDRITYRHADKADYDYTNPEEKVRAYTYSWLILKRGYPSENIKTEVTVPRRTPEDSADIVVYESNNLDTPYLVVENKKSDLPDSEWNQAVEQGFGNANSLRETTYMLVDKYTKSELYDIQNHPPTERDKNQIGGRDRLPETYDEEIEFRLIAGEDPDIEPSGVSKLEQRIRRTHAEIWSGGKRDPLTSFDEWSKLLFAKIHDERHTRNGDPRRFQSGLGQSPSQVANQIHELFEDAREEDPTVFQEVQINLPSEKINTVVKILEEESFTGQNLDRIGRAFEEFFGQIFRGQLGQYFTRRELTRFVVGVIEPENEDFILDPTVGSGGFLLEALFQVWKDIEDNYEKEEERLKYDFAQNHLYGIEIHPILARICKTNLILHKDGHTNIEGDKSCLDSNFEVDRIDDGEFDVIIGNPPFGDSVEEGDRDRLGENSLENFELKKGSKIKTEIAVIERSIKFLKEGGELGFVVPDGLLNNYSERSNCPQLRRYLLREGKIKAIVSLPDHAFTKAGAQNKTSIIFFRKYTTQERRELHSDISEVLDERDIEDEDELTGAEKWDVMTEAVSQNDYQTFLAEAEEIGYDPTGQEINKNDLYSLGDESIPKKDDLTTILGQYREFKNDPSEYDSSEEPEAISISCSDMIGQGDGRIDPKYHIVQHQAMDTPPKGTKKLRLGDVLEERDERVDPTEHPDTEFKVPTLKHDGSMEQREAGKNKAPVAWEGQYFSGKSAWHYMYEGDVLYSRIDLWKGAISIVGEEFDGAICTTEFPVYKIEDKESLDPHYLKLLLRSSYFQEAIRGITTGHSNRRRTQEEDFEDLEIFVPEIKEQRKIASEFGGRTERIKKAENELEDLRDTLDKAVTGEVSVDKLIEQETDEMPEKQAQLSEMDE
ncbi:MAG: N-6 DNA methylase [Halobacteriales archaeon]|nr:N-6 DNA methylase [Halobacteriales archaeon]